MKKLTDYQRDFIINTFFVNESFAGWKNIAIQLLETGECVVAGNNCIWTGGIGNFIKTERYEHGVGCSLYKFIFNDFINSKFYLDQKKQYQSDLSIKHEQAEQQLKELEKQIKEILELK